LLKALSRSCSGKVLLCHPRRNLPIKHPMHQVAEGVEVEAALLDAEVDVVEGGVVRGLLKEALGKC